MDDAFFGFQSKVHWSEENKDVNSHKDDRKYVSQTLKLVNPSVIQLKPSLCQFT